MHKLPHRLNVPEAKMEKFSSLGSTFLVKRFDRIGERSHRFQSFGMLLPAFEVLPMEELQFLYHQREMDHLVLS